MTTIEWILQDPERAVELYTARHMTSAERLTFEALLALAED